VSLRRLVFDVAANIAMYVPVGLLAYLTAAKRRRWMAAFFAAALGATLSAAIEMAQVFTPRRNPSAMDLVSNTGGAALGALAGAIVEERLRARRRRPAGEPAGTVAAPALLLCCFAAYQIYPLIPHPTLRALRSALYALADSRVFSPTSFVAGAADWLTAASLACLAARGRAATAVFYGLAALLPLRVFIYSRTLQIAELLACGAAIAVRHLVTGRGRLHVYIAAGALTAAILLRGLVPVSGTAAPFSWKPFGALFVSSGAGVASILLLKAFRYGGLIVLLEAAGWRVAGATASVILLLSLVEFAQIWTPGHVPEITDPFLAALLGMLLLALERHLAARDRSM
jgi:VanZ family protein